MDGDSNYRQHGYQDRDQRDFRPYEDRPWQQGPKLPIDVTGPRLPRMVQTVTAARCWNCAVTLSPSVEFKGTCPKCAVALHCCKMCAHFEPATRFQCLKPVPQRVAPKDEHNECELFSPRVTVARDANNAGSQAPAAQAPRSSADARAAFDNLFKK